MWDWKAQKLSSVGCLCFLFGLGFIYADTELHMLTHTELKFSTANSFFKHALSGPHSYLLGFSQRYRFIVTFGELYMLGKASTYQRTHSAEHSDITLQEIQEWDWNLIFYWLQQNPKDD